MGNYSLKDLSNLPGKKTTRKMVVFESDDWGSIRMPSLDAFKRMEAYGIDLRSHDAERYNQNDTLANHDDLIGLFEVLSNVKDSHGHSAVFTPVCIVANPDFERIKNSGYQRYFYEIFPRTLERYYPNEQTFDTWKIGVNNKLFLPQLHGREHLNVTAWMNCLLLKDLHSLRAFNEEHWGFVPKEYPNVDYQAAFLFDKTEELIYQKQVINEATKIFFELFEVRAEFFVPPNGIFNNALNDTLVQNGIKYRYASKLQNEPIGRGLTKKKFHYHGQKDKSGLRYVIRNCFFEPSQPGKDWVDSCMQDIQRAFNWRKPAIIGSHRVNYIGSLRPENRAHGLKSLSELLVRIINKWPDAEFMSTPQMCQELGLS